jgi:hypothetical protein
MTSASNLRLVNKNVPPAVPFLCVPDNTIDREKPLERKEGKRKSWSAVVGICVQTMREMIQSSLSTHIYIYKMRLTHFWNVYTEREKETAENI